MTENPNRSCSRCGTAISTDAAGGLCPRCLMAMNFDSRTMPEGEEPPHAPPMSPEELAEKFPQYEILECLGRGGMGVVYKARQKSLDRMVAIKILPPERVGEAKFSDRFAVEAATLAKLSHPNIVTIHDFGETGGLFYLVMEYVDGVNLRDLLRDGKLEPKQALAIVPPICEALQYAHDKGIVHRDIKPENLLLDRDGRIKIADFGIASLVGANGDIAGTPPYMAPEQSAARNGIDHRADIYALGVVLYEMLTGERPGKDLVAPSKKVQIDVRLDEMVLRALEKEPERRYQTAGEFRTVIETMQQPALNANPPPIPDSSPPRGMFRRWWWLFLVMIPLGLAFGLAAGAVLNYVIPKKYEAECTIEVKPPAGSQITPQFFGTQFEKLKSRETLAEVCKRLELENRWMLQEEGAIRILKGVINVQNIRGTDLINIRVRHTNALDAAGIANSLSLIYQETSPIKVLVHETAVVPKLPASPNLTLTLVLAALAGLITSPLLALLAMAILHRLIPERRADVPVSGNPITDSPLPGTTAFAGIAVALLLLLTATNNAMVMMIGSGVALIVGLIWFAKGRSRLALLVALASLGVAGVVALILDHRSSEARAITVDPSEMAITRVLADGNKVLIEGRALANARIGIHAGERGNGWSCAFPQDCRFTATLEKTRSGLKCRVQPDTGEPILTLDGTKQTGDVKLAEGELVFRAGQPVRDHDGAWVADIGEWTSKQGAKVPIRVSLWLLKPAASEENRNAAPKSAAVDADVSAMAFGPVIERVLSGIDSLSNCYLDAETGHVLSAPRQFVEDLKAKGQLHQGNTQLMNLTDWARVNGADFVLQYQNPDTSLQLLEGFTIANTVPFESCEASKVVHYATEIQSTMAPRVQPGFHMSCQLGAPDVDSWIFRTREGSAGVLQLTAVKDNPRDVKIRYKLVQSTTQKPPESAAPEQTANGPNQRLSWLLEERPPLAEARPGLDAAPTFPLPSDAVGWAESDGQLNPVMYLAKPVPRGGSEAPVEGNRRNPGEPIRLNIYRGTNPLATANRFLGSYEITCQPPDAAIRAEFSLSPDGQLHLNVIPEKKGEIVGGSRLRPPDPPDKPSGSIRKMVVSPDKILIEDLALHMIVAIREKDDAKLKSLATDRIKGWPEALPVFAVEMREHYRQMVGDEKFDMRAAESLVDGDLAAVKCTGPEKLKGVCLVLFFVKTADGWRNHSLRNAAGDTPLAKLLADLKVAIQKEK